MSDNPSRRPTRCCKTQRRLLALAPSCVGSLPMPDRALAANLAIRCAVGIRGCGGVPVIVDGRVWGLAAVGSARPGPMPADTEVRISGFAELVGGVVVAGYRDEQKRQLLGDLYLSVRCWLVRCSRGDPLIAGARGKSRGVCGCRPVVRSW